MTTKLNANPLVQYLQKPAGDFTKADIIKFIENNGIQMVNFRYAGHDGRLKTLHLMISDFDYLDTFLSSGERVDGSSLFANIEAGSSDLYVIPRFATAFINPFAEVPTIDILCAYFNKDGNPFADAPEYLLCKAHRALHDATGMTFEAMGELEYYVIGPVDELFAATDQRGYHESEPFCKWTHFRTAAMRAITQAGGLIKYGHSEVGNFTLNGQLYEQNEIEFIPTRLENAADQLMIAKWIIRTMAHRYGITVTFAPKITLGKAGSGMHIHTRLWKDGRNVLIENGRLTDAAKHVIAGYLSLAPSLTAFGNTNPTSYFRLVPNQEAPTNICWGDRNRAALVRVPLGWSVEVNMSKVANPLEPVRKIDFSPKQTVEFRCSDGSADIYQLLAGLAVAVRHGFEMEDALSYANHTYAGITGSGKQDADTPTFAHLPASCAESADALEEQRTAYERYGVFSPGMIDGILTKLRAFNDRKLRQEITGHPDRMQELIRLYFHCG
ncbi:MAG: glutamine synthetase family protein [Prevotellaceae bacterium]|jgi:glutamine synthetase|nr:glutamine synthetase family protein [Prevotellaceae bacterium]